MEVNEFKSGVKEDNFILESRQQTDIKCDTEI